ncbi:MAG: sulfatase [Draconibacterium sp.]
MNVKSKLVCGFTAIVSLAGFNQVYAQKQVQDKPNVIIINMDDMGYGDTEPYGMTGIPTPNFNTVAKEGLRFTHFYASQPVCSASRAALLTGCYSTRVGINGAILAKDKVALDPKEETIASMLKENGYSTGMFGKWHLGNDAPYLPTLYGFDEFFGLKYSNDIWPYDYLGNRVTDPNSRKFHNPTLMIVDGVEPVDSIKTMEDQGRLTSLFTEKAVSFINRNKDNLFFLYLAHPMPHAPIAAGERFKGKSELGEFGDVMMELDWSLGEIMKALEGNKIAENTLLIVTSDNGPWLHFGDHAGSNAGFREGKLSTFEGGARVPLIVRWPGKVESSWVESELMTNMDILPTIAAATGSKLPEQEIDGLNFLPLWEGKTETGPRDVFYYYFGFGKANLQAVRYKNWKLVFPHAYNSYSGLHGKDGNPGVLTKANVSLSLYDLAHDPGEQFDVSVLYPEVVKKMQELAEEARDKFGDDMTQREGKEVRGPLRY